MKTNYQNRALYLLSAGILAASPGSPVFATPTCIVEANISPDNQTHPEVTPLNNPTVVKLNGQSSKPNSGATYLWEQTAGTTVTLSDIHDAQPTFNAPDVGPAGEMLIFKLTVTGCSPSQSSFTLTTVNVTDVYQNRPPVASATVSPADIYEGYTVTLDGTASSDPDGNPLTYAWTQVDGAPVTLANPNTAVATFTAPSAPYPNGTSFKLKLTVSDGSLTGTTDAIVNVQWTNSPPVANVSCPSPVDEGASVTLDGSGSSDPDDGIDSYLWSQTLGGPIPVLPPVLTTSSISFVAPILTSPLDTMSFKLVVTDQGGLANSAECDVKVNDKTPPVISSVNLLPVEATSAAGAVVSYTVTANDAVDGPVAVSCTSNSGSTFAIGSTPVNCSATDAAGNKATSSFTVTVRDTTPPALNLPGNITAEATGPSGAAVNYSASATDLVDGSVTPICTPASGSTFGLTTTAVNCSATDTHGNTASGSFNVTVQDTTPPAITVPADIVTGPTAATGATVNYSGYSAVDLVDGALTATCSPASGSLFNFGDTKVECSATDSHNNKGSKQFTVTVNPFTFLGFFQPVDNTPTLNTVKNGSTVPVKWKLQGQNGVEITETAAIASIKAASFTCTGSAEDAIEATATGGTSLRYDSTAQQFIYNWQTPKQPNTCWRLDVTLKDGSSAKSANFKLK